MQVNTPVTGAVPQGARRRSDVLLPEVLQLLQGNMQQVQPADTRQDRIHRQHREAEELAHDTAATQLRSERTIKAQRNMLYERREADMTHAREQIDRRQAVRNQEIQRRASASPTRFRDALQDARREPTTTPSQSDRPTVTTRQPEAESTSKPGSGEAIAGRAASHQSQDPTATKVTADATSARAGSMMAADRSIAPAGPIRIAPADARRNATMVQSIGKSVASAKSATPAQATPVQQATSSNAKGSGPQASIIESGRAVAERGKRTVKSNTPAEAERKSDPNVDRVLRILHSRIGKGRSITTIRLDPPELGMLRIRMDLRNDQLFVEAQTETPAARKLLTEHVDALRKGLESGGVHLERFEVRGPTVVDEPSDAQQPRQEAAANRDQQATPQHDGRSAGGGSSKETDFPTELPPDDAAREIPDRAVDSLVNVLA